MRAGSRGRSGGVWGREAGSRSLSFCGGELIVGGVSMAECVRADKELVGGGGRSGYDLGVLRRG